MVSQHEISNFFFLLIFINTFRNMANLGQQCLERVLCCYVEQEQTHVSDDRYKETSPQNVIPSVVADKSSFLVRFFKY